MKRVAIWNGGPVADELGGGTRGNTKFNPGFDIALLSEEVKEFYLALANNDLVEMIDAVCDMRFVYEGIQFKFGCTTYSYQAASIDNFVENDKAFARITDYYNYHFNAADDLISQEIYKRYGENLFGDFDAIYKIKSRSYDAVCSANEQKGIIKDENGKTMKGPKWVNPAEAIAQIIEEEIAASKAMKDKIKATGK